MLSTATIVSFLVRRAKKSGRSLAKVAGFSVVASGIALVLNQMANARRRTVCEEDRDAARRRCDEYEARTSAVCDEYEAQSYQVCDEYEDRGYHACSEYEDRGYHACSEYEDRGYSACDEWRKNCCDWWPCSWFCELFSWICVAWVWISNIVCVAWVWVSNLVCVAWFWVTNLVCVAWTFVTTWVCRAWTWVTTLICVAWAVISYPVCTLICALRRLFADNEVSMARSECIYGWTAAYRIIEQKDCELHIELRIRLVPDADVSAADIQNVQAVWEPAIEAAWANQFAIVQTKGGCACKEYDVTVDVRWVESGEHHAVAVHSGSGRADMLNWFVNSSGGTAAHEAGHMFGNVDEYPDSACPDRDVTTDGSIMRSSQTGTVRPRNYQGFATWVSNRTCCDYEVAS